MSRRDRGSVTVEMALVLPAVMMLVLVGIGAIAFTTHKLGCLARARDTALAAARGEEIPPPGSGSPDDDASVEYRPDGTVIATVQSRVGQCVQTAAIEP